MTVSRIMPNVTSDHVEAARDFYVSLLDLDVAFESDWFVQLTVPGDPTAGLGILRRDHETVPAGDRHPPRGVIITLVVDDADTVHRRASSQGLEIVQAPHDTSYGQRRLLVRDPDGTLVDISSPTAPLAPEYRDGV